MPTDEVFRSPQPWDADARLKAYRFYRTSGLVIFLGAFGLTVNEASYASAHKNTLAGVLAAFGLLVGGGQILFVGLMDKLIQSQNEQTGGLSELKRQIQPFAQELAELRISIETTSRRMTELEGSLDAMEARATEIESFTASLVVVSPEDFHEQVESLNRRLEINEEMGHRVDDQAALELFAALETLDQTQKGILSSVDQLSARVNVLFDEDELKL